MAAHAKITEFSTQESGVIYQPVEADELRSNADIGALIRSGSAMEAQDLALLQRARKVIFQAREKTGNSGPEMCDGIVEVHLAPQDGGDVKFVLVEFQDPTPERPNAILHNDNDMAPAMYYQSVERGRVLAGCFEASRQKGVQSAGTVADIGTQVRPQMDMELG